MGKVTAPQQNAVQRKLGALELIVISQIHGKRCALRIQPGTVRRSDHREQLRTVAGQIIGSSRAGTVNGFYHGAATRAP